MYRDSQHLFIIAEKFCLLFCDVIVYDQVSKYACLPVGLGCFGARGLATGRGPPLGSVSRLWGLGFNWSPGGPSVAASSNSVDLGHKTQVCNRLLLTYLCIPTGVFRADLSTHTPIQFANHSVGISRYPVSDP